MTAMEDDEMTIVVVDRALSEKLRAASNGTEIRDVAGELIGIFEKPSRHSSQNPRPACGDSDGRNDGPNS